jgi:hypothetical protein
MLRSPTPLHSSCLQEKNRAGKSNHEKAKERPKAMA